MKKIEVEIPEGKRAIWVNNVQTLVDEQPKSIIDRVKTFEDACAILGEDNWMVKAYEEVYNRVETSGEDLISYMKLRIVCAALNEGWVAKEHMNEEWWYPWFNRFDKSNEIDYEGHVPAISCNGSATEGGVVSALAPFDASYTYSSYGSHLALKSKKLAEYCGNKFIHLWADYLLG